MLSPEALAADVEDGSCIKDPVECAQQGVLLVEVLPPQGRVAVAGEDDVVSPFLVVAPVNQVEEQPGILLIELTVPNFVNNQAGRAYQTIENGCFLACPSSGGELISQLGHLNKIGFNAPLTALIAKSLSQMRLAGSGRANECQVPVGIDGRQGWQRFELGCVPALNNGEIKVFKGLGIF